MVGACHPGADVGSEWAVRATALIAARPCCAGVSDWESAVVGPVSTVLLVDGVVDLREVLCEFLSMEGARCVPAASLSQVEAQADAALAAQLAILDVNLGELQPNGVDVCRWLRERGFAGPIVFLTGHAATDPRVVEASRQPNTRVLAKPVASDTIASLVASGR